MSHSFLQFEARVCTGHGVASGRSVGQAHNPYPQGTIAMQAAFFIAVGVDVTGLKLATLNVSLAPLTWGLRQADHCIEKLEWTHLHPPETFSFVRIEALWQDVWHKGWIYLPHPETKAAHFQNASVMELILPPLEGVQAGDPLALRAQSQAIELINQPSD